MTTLYRSSFLRKNTLAMVGGVDPSRRVARYHFRADGDHLFSDPHRRAAQTGRAEPGDIGLEPMRSAATC